MNRKSKIIKSIVLLSFVLFVAFCAVFISIASAVQISANKAEKNKIIQDEQTMLASEKYIASNEIYSLTADLMYLKDVYEMYEDVEQNNETIKRLWTDFAAREKIYDQIRYIDENGDEIIRINYEDGTCTPVSDGLLQNKADRYYFEDSVGLEEGQIYISKLDLNVENGEIEQPIKPMIRLATPVHNQDGTPGGIVIINYNAQYLLDAIDEVTSTAQGDIYLLNQGGYWLYNSQDPDKAWTFMYEEGQDTGFFSEYPDAWAQMDNSSRGIVWTDDGCFIYTSISLLEGSGPYDFIVPGDSIVLGEGSLIAVSFIHPGTESGELFATSVWDNILYTVQNNLFGIFALLALAIFLAIIIVTRTAASKRTKYFSEYDIMTGVMNRRAGLELLKKAHRRAAENNGMLSICYVDVNGLKEVNDHIGHEAGDALISSVVDVLKQHIRQTDFVIRLGGDEFLIVLGQSSMQNTEAVWTRIVAEFERINQTEERRYLISVSHGIMSFTLEPNEDVEEVINAADQKMYEEKRALKKKLTIIKDKDRP